MDGEANQTLEEIKAKEEAAKKAAQAEAAAEKEKAVIFDAFNRIKHGVDLAMQGKFPTGLDHIEAHYQLKSDLQALASKLNKVYGMTTEQ